MLRRCTSLVLVAGAILMFPWIGWTGEAPVRAFVVRRDGQHGWTRDVRGTGRIEFVEGPGVPPSREGSVLLAVGSDTSGVAQLRNNRLAYTPLSEIFAMRYWTFIPKESGPFNAYLLLHVDRNADQKGDDVLCFEPSQNGSIKASEWQEWDAWKGRWVKLPADVNSRQTFTIADYKAKFPKAQVVDSAKGDGGFRVVVGSGQHAAWRDFQCFVDLVQVDTKGIDGTRTLPWDFESKLLEGPSPSPAPTAPK